MNKCIVLYESWQMECCGEDFAINSNIHWLVCDGAKVKLPIKIEKIDYYYEAHSSNYEKLLVLEGTVKQIKALYEKYKPDNNNPKLLIPVEGALYNINSSTIIDNKKNNMFFSAYLVYIENYSIRLALKSEITYK